MVLAADLVIGPVGLALVVLLLTAIVLLLTGRIP
jgi:hypothetical protein